MQSDYDAVMAQQIIMVDAFTDQPFTGNPAAVCVLDREVDERWMQQIAREINYAETAFVRKAEDHYALRWFSPTVEVDLCGHATLASAHVLWQTGQLAMDAPAHFETRSGRLLAMRRGDWIELDFPTTPASSVPAPAGLGTALNAEIVSSHRSRFDLLIELADEGTIAQLQPDIGKLKRYPVRGVIVTAPGSSPYDFVSRFFAPQTGVDEDPVTGSAHCALGEFWQSRLGKSDMLARQVSARGGTVRVQVKGERTLLLGQAVTTMRCELIV